MVGAILTQNTSWSNVEKAISNFKQELTAQLIKQLSINDLAQTIKPSGYYNQKAKKLKALTDWFEQYDFNILNTKHKTTLQLRTELLSIFGVGKETADCILTYALKKPSFIIDTYTKRLLTRLGFKLPNEYNEIQNLFQQSIAPDLYKYNEYHALIVKHATEFCFKTPKCTNCPLLSLCQREHVS
nr:endonuclease [Clostridium sp. 'deep sea']